MTWGATILSGSGKLSFRFHIEGAMYDWVTDTAMIKAGTTGAGAVAARKLGLKRDGSVFGEDIDILHAKLKCKAPSIRIADIGGHASYAFTKIPTRTCWLTGGVLTSGTSLTVTSNTGWTAGDILHLNTEAMHVTGTSSTDTINVDRAVYGTQAQAHFTIGDQAGLAAPEVNNEALCLQGRRCRLYVYGEGDDPQGSGTLVWNGLVLGDPESDNGGAEWTIPCGGLDRILDKNFGVQFGPFKPRGVYYTALNPFVLLLGEMTGASALGGTTAHEATVTMIGFWESNADFVAELNTQIQLAIAAFSMSVSARESGDPDQWSLVVQTTPASPRFIYNIITSLVDRSGNDWVDSSTGSIVTEFDSSSEYTKAIYSGSVRSTAFEEYPGAGADLSLSATYPPLRMYLNGDIGAYFTTSTISIQPPGGIPGEHSGAVYWANSYTIDTTDNFIDFFVRPAFGAHVIPAGYGTVFGRYSAEPLDRMYAVTIAGHPFDAVGDVGAFMNALATYSNEYANLGTMPLISSSEFDTSSVAAVNEAIAGRAWGSGRSFRALPNKKLGEILAEELKLIGCYLAIGGTGKLRIRRVTGPLSVVPSDSAALTSATILTDETFPQWRKNTMGLINTLEFQDGYDADEDDWTGDVVRVTDATAFGVTQTATTLTISPYSSGPPVTLGDIVDVGGSAFALFSYPYASVTCDVPISKFSAVLAGNTITMATKHIYDPALGRRLLAGEVSGGMLIVGREWDLTRARGRITTYYPINAAAGYAPAMYIDSDGGAGTSWTFSVTGDSPISGASILPDSTNAEDFFATDMRVNVYAIDDDAPTYYAGIITSVSGSSIDVTFDSAFGGIGADLYVITYAPATDALLTPEQKRFCYVADSDRVIDFSTAKPARTFGG